MELKTHETLYTGGGHGKIEGLFGKRTYITEIKSNQTLYGGLDMVLPSSLSALFVNASLITSIKSGLIARA